MPQSTSTKVDASPSSYLTPIHPLPSTLHSAHHPTSSPTLQVPNVPLRSKDRHSTFITSIPQCRSTHSIPRAKPDVMPYYLPDRELIPHIGLMDRSEALQSIHRSTCASNSLALAPKGIQHKRFAPTRKHLTAHIPLERKTNFLTHTRGRSGGADAETRGKFFFP